MGRGSLSEISWLISFNTWLGAANIGHGLSSSILSLSALRFMFLEERACEFKEMLYLAKYCSTPDVLIFIFFI